MAIQWPRIVSGLANDILPNLAGWNGVVQIFDGPLGTQIPRPDYCTVGEQLGQAAQGSGSTTQHPNGGERIEPGDIHCQLVSQTGNKNMAEMRTRVFGFIDELDEYIRVNRRLGGLLSPEGTSDLSFEPLGLFNPQGTAVALNFTITYMTVT